MAITVTDTARVTKQKIGLGGFPLGGNGGRGGGPRGNGGSGGGGGGGKNGPRRQEFLPDRYRIGIWVGLAAVAMMFTALSSAYVVRSVSTEGANDWHPISMPRVLWLSTALIIASSVTFEAARRYLRRGSERGYSRWLLATVVLGLGFLASQLLAWRELVAQGIYLAANPHASFFYLLTGAHALHLLGGVLALDYLLLRSWRPQKAAATLKRRQAAADVVAIYWHFMDGLWIYLFLLLFMWR